MRNEDNLNCCCCRETFGLGKRKERGEDSYLTNYRLTIGRADDTLPGLLLLISGLSCKLEEEKVYHIYINLVDKAGKSCSLGRISSLSLSVEIYLWSKLRPNFNI